MFPVCDFEIRKTPVFPPFYTKLSHPVTLDIGGFMQFINICGLPGALCKKSLFSCLTPVENRLIIPGFGTGEIIQSFPIDKSTQTFNRRKGPERTFVNTESMFSTTRCAYHEIRRSAYQTECVHPTRKTSSDWR